MSGESKEDISRDDAVRRRSPSQLAKQQRIAKEYWSKKAKKEEGLRRRRAANRINRAEAMDRLTLVTHPRGESYLATPEEPPVFAPSGKVRVKFQTKDDLTGPGNLLMTAGAGALVGAVAGGAAHHIVQAVSGYAPRVGGDAGALFGATHAVTKAALRKVRDRRGTVYTIPTEGSKATVVESQGDRPSIPSYEVPMTREEFEHGIPRLRDRQNTSGLRRRRRTRGRGKKRRRRTRRRRKRRTHKRRKRRRSRKRRR